MVTAATPTLIVTKGTCCALFAYEIGSSINLDQGDQHISAAGTERGRLLIVLIAVSVAVSFFPVGGH